MRRHLAAACVLAVLGAGAIPPSSGAGAEQPLPPTAQPSVRVSGPVEGVWGNREVPPAPNETSEPEIDIGDYLLGEINKYRRETWRWERLMRVRRTPAPRAAARSNDREHRLLILKSWKRKAAKRRRQANRPPHLSAWLCIKRYEGPWNDPSPPYYGGLQMDLSFQRTYAPELLRRKGTADRWTPVEQIWVAERAYRSGRGFTPWPNTARSCGLL